jgi:hypothetical protein
MRPFSGRIKGEDLSRKRSADTVDDLNQTDRRLKGHTNVAIKMRLKHPMKN